MSQPRESSNGDLSVIDLAWLSWHARPSDPGTCRVCGGELTVGRMGGGRPTVYHCSVPRPIEARREGRDEDAAWQHFRDSEVEVTRHGDPAVRALVAEVRRRREEVGEPAYPEIGAAHEYAPGRPSGYVYEGDDTFVFRSSPDA